MSFESLVLLGKPIVCFEGTGGIPALVGTEGGRSVAPVTADAMAGAILDIVGADCGAEMGRALQSRIKERHDIEVVAPEILRIMNDTIG